MTRTETNSIVRDLALSPLKTLEDVDKDQLIVIQLNSIIMLLADVSKSMAVIADKVESED